MLRRFSLVVWWLGALMAATGLISCAFGLVVLLKGEAVPEFFATAALLAVATGVLWAVAFVLAGSFWRPPKLEQMAT
jgi:hypothetical protein